MHSRLLLTVIALTAIGPSGCAREPAVAEEAHATEATLRHWQQPRVEQPTATPRELPMPAARLTELATAEAPAPAPAPADASLLQALIAYEGTRARLALDDLAGAKAEARKLTAANQPLVKLVAAARVFDAAPELTSARSAFGVLSQQVIRLLIERPTLRSGRKLYFCPMVHSYNKWVQGAGPIDNPYIGKHLSRCGVELTAWDAAS